MSAAYKADLMESEARKHKAEIDRLERENAELLAVCRRVAPLLHELHLVERGDDWNARAEFLQAVGKK